MNYELTVAWDPDLRDVWFVDTDTIGAAFAGLAYHAVKVTTGAPSNVTTAGHFIRGGEIKNAFTGIVYLNAGTTASPSWEAIEAGTIALPNGQILVGNVSGIATAVAMSGDATITNTGVVTVIGLEGIAFDATVAAPNTGDVIYFDGTNYVAAPSSIAPPSPYSLGAAAGYNTMSGTTLTLTNPQFFTTGNIGETTLVGTPSFGTGSDLGSTGLAAAVSAMNSLRATLAALSGTAIITPAAFETDDYGYGVGVFVPGVYKTASAIGGTAAGSITLSGPGDYVFVSTGGAITFGATFTIILTNGATASRVYWVANNAITTGANDVLKGNFMAGAAGAITVGSTNNIEGRLLSPVAITIDGTATNLYLPIA